MNITVGILNSLKIAFCLNENFYFEQEKTKIKGDFFANIIENGISFNGKTYYELYFRNLNNSTFELFDVEIGKGFHWQCFKNQQFNGDLKIISNDTKLWAINCIDIEKYLYSVIGSEMSSTSFTELLKAHAVISRSWLLANISKDNPNRATEQRTNHTFIKYYERDTHMLFDVCADDHCQRYQGIAAAQTPQILQAIDQTKGEVLTFDGDVCDARFSKCCGGYTECFSSCWDNRDFPYLQALPDIKNDFFWDLSKEENAEKWILSSPDVFCNILDKNIINQVFNDFDKETNDFFRWKICYSNSELSRIIKCRSGIDFGGIIDLIPVKRGLSGRIVLLKIVGEKFTLTLGKELEIRKWLSNSHLYSSAFVVKKDENGTFTFYGAGWGHGVGLCQTGAATMSAKGFDYREILMHYFKGTEIVNIS
ncbi:MAG: SpoIID/LytB domain-containing protein [Prevotellaceae bacterium]|jgi:SpoIID/LytB domain protein|nr:SpoIID/LytB domain-containing protein [Prevotellaceae bacterium]